MLDEKEHVETDDLYIGKDPKLIKVPKQTQYQQNDNECMVAGLTRYHHETGNCLFTKLGILG